MLLNPFQSDLVEAGFARARVLTVLECGQFDSHSISYALPINAEFGNPLKSGPTGIDQLTDHSANNLVDEHAFEADELGSPCSLNAKLKGLAK